MHVLLALAFLDPNLVRILHDQLELSFVRRVQESHVCTGRGNFGDLVVLLEDCLERLFG